MTQHFPIPLSATTYAVSVKVAIIGTGWADRVQIPAFQQAGLEVVAVSGRTPEKTQRVANDHGVPHAVSDWRELLALECELISVTSPPSLHCEQTCAILEAGKHLLCEKPTALSHAEATKMVEAARAKPELLALIDHELRFVPARRKAKELLDAGVLGRLLTVTARVTNGSRLDPDTPWTWWANAEEGGGILGAIGSHVLDGIRWLLADEGEIDIAGACLAQSYPERRAPDGTMRQVSADDIASVTFKIGRVTGTMLVHGASLDEPEDLLTICGSEGTLVLDKSLKLYLGKRGGSLKEYVTSLSGLVPNRFRANPFAAGTVLLGEAIADALDPQRPAVEQLRHAATLQDGLEVQRLLDEIRRVAL